MAVKKKKNIYQSHRLTYYQQWIKKIELLPIETNLILWLVFKFRTKL